MSFMIITSNKLTINLIRIGACAVFNNATYFQKILSQSVVSVHIEIRPKYLVPDTNCFIDYLVMIKAVAEVQFYTLMVPLVGKYIAYIFLYCYVLNIADENIRVPMYNISVHDAFYFAINLRFGNHKIFIRNE